MDLKNHCIFCLQRYSLDEVSSFVGKNIRPFELLRNYFCGGGEVSFQIVKASLGNVSNQEKSLLPSCQSCSAHFENLQKLHDQMMDIQELIKVQLKAIRGIVSGAAPTSKDDIRWNHFMEILLTLGQPESQAKMTCELVKNFQRLIVNDFERGLDCEGDPAHHGLEEVVKQEAIDDLEDLDFQRNDFDNLDDFSFSLPEQDDPMSEEGEGLDWKESIPKIKAVKKKRKRKMMFPLKKQTKKCGMAPCAPGPCQKCDLCGVKVPIEKILSHVQEHVGEYATKCSNARCRRVFSCRMKMLRHVRGSLRCKKVVHINSIQEESGVSGKCQVCDSSAPTIWHLRDHLRVHEAEMRANPSTTDAIKECPITGCSESFYLRQSMEYHLFRHNLRSATQQNCPLCEESFEVTEMENHLKDNHQVTEVFKCNHCSFLFNNADEKIKHVLGHRKDKGVSCDICNDDTVKIKSLVTLRQHYFNVHQLGTSPTVVCQHCGKEYASSIGLIIHVRTVHPDISGPVAAAAKKMHKCDLCTQEYSSVAAVTNHKIKVHGAAHLPCGICSETFPSTGLLYTHMRTHTGAVHKCNFEGCNKEFPTRSSLTKHEICHSEVKEKPYKCDTCGTGFGLKENLKSHIRTMHLNTRVPCVCDVCGKSFLGPLNLKAHMLVHTGERAYVCSMCGKAYRSLSTLGKHTKETHEKEKKPRKKYTRKNEKNIRRKKK